MASSTTAHRESTSICDVAGIEVGHFSDTRRPTGCTVILARGGAVAGVDVRGAAPGTRETDLLSPTNTVEQVHAVLLAGGSAWGLDAAGGVMRWLDEQGIGLQVGQARVPIVPAAVLFDLDLDHVGIRPDAQAGYAACAAASRNAPQEGCVGAGTGATVGRFFPKERWMKGGIGTSSLTLDGVTVGAIVACNAMGDVIDPESGRIVAGGRTADGKRLGDVRRSLLQGEVHRKQVTGTNTTIGVIATDAVLTKTQASRLATVGHDGLARAINPTHTLFDGDALFVLATGRSGKPFDMVMLSIMAADAVAQAIVRGVRAATRLQHNGLDLPAASDID